MLKDPYHAMTHTEPRRLSHRTEPKLRVSVTPFEKSSGSLFISYSTGSMVEEREPLKYAQKMYALFLKTYDSKPLTFKQ